MNFAQKMKERRERELRKRIEREVNASPWPDRVSQLISHGEYGSHLAYVGRRLFLALQLRGVPVPHEIDGAASAVVSLAWRMEDGARVGASLYGAILSPYAYQVGFRSAPVEGQAPPELKVESYLVTEHEDAAERVKGWLGL